jgi:hypothetical protein
LVVGGAGAAGYAYVKGEHEQVYPYPIAQTASAVRDAIHDMALPVVSDAADELGARFESRTAQGEKVVITLEPQGQAVTKVGIRLGVFGDEDASRTIAARIDEHLPAPQSSVHVGVSVSR